jgi:hypothetical protein
MVTLTVFVEGGPNDGRPAADTAQASAAFREGFRKLFAQLPLAFRLVIEPIGPVSRAREYLARIEAEGQEALVLVDLDAPPAERQQRIEQFYKGLNTGNLYFMVQEMEAWILSQPHAIEAFARGENWRPKSPPGTLSEAPALRRRPPEEIPHPSGVLDTLFRQHFEMEQKRGGQHLAKPARYHKMQHAPALIAGLDIHALKGAFGDVKALAERLGP